MKKKVFAIFLILAMVLTCLTSCGGGDGEKTAFDDGYGENVIRIATEDEQESGDPRQTSASYFIPMNIFDTLVQTVPTEDGGSKIQPSAAKSWEISEDGKTYSMHLNEGIKFTNGEEMTSDDVLYTIDSMLDPERATVNSEVFSVLDGAIERLDGKLDTLEGRGIIIHDDYNFDLVLKEAYSPFIATLSTPGWSILNREACDAGDEAGGGKESTYFGAQPEYTIGSGPFILKDWQLNDHVYLEANKDYWKGAPKLDGVLLKIVKDPETQKMMFETGQLDILDLDISRSFIPEFQESEEWKDNIVQSVTFSTKYLTFNENIEPFDDVRVRKAIQMAIDKQKILDTLYEGAGTVANGIFPKSMVGYNENLPEIPYDVEAAKKLLKEAGYENGFDMEITCTADDSQELFQIVQQQLAELNINVTINQMDEASWYDIRSTGELGMYTSTWSGDFNDPDNFIYTFFSKQTTKGRSFNYSNKEVMERIEAARHIVDVDERLKEYQELEKIIAQDDAAWVPLFHLDKMRVVQDRVTKFVPQWAGWGNCCYFDAEVAVSGE